MSYTPPRDRISADVVGLSSVVERKSAEAGQFAEAALDELVRVLARATARQHHELMEAARR